MLIDYFYNVNRLLFVYIFMCLHCLKDWHVIKIEIETRIYCIDLYDDDRISLQPDGVDTIRLQR